MTRFSTFIIRFIGQASSAKAWNSSLCQKVLDGKRRDAIAELEQQLSMLQALIDRQMAASIEMFDGTELAN